MKRKIVYVGIPYFIGLFLASFLDKNYDFSIMLLILAGILVLKYVSKFTNKEIIVCAISFIIAFSWFRIYQGFTYEKVVSCTGEKVTFSGKISFITEYTGDKSCYLLKGKLNSRYNAKVLYYGDSVVIDRGDEIKIVGTVKRFENKYTFNAKDYYEAKGIFLQFDEVETVELTQNDDFSIINVILKYRENILHRIKQILPNEEGDILIGILFGDKSGLSDSTQTTLYRTGIGHVMSVSGLHVVILATFLYLILNLIALKNWHKFLIIEIAIALFTVCSGMSMSVIRAFIMITLTESSVLFYRRSDVLNSLCIAVIIITLPSPFVIRDASFLLSVSGAFGIGVFAQYMTKGMPDEKGSQKLIKIIIAFSLVTLFVFPISILFFDETSIISPIANLILIPLCNVALICGLLVTVTGGVNIFAYPLLTVAGICCKIVLRVSHALGRIEYTYISLGYKYLSVSIIMLTVFVAATFVLFKKPKFVAVSIGISMLILVVESTIYRISQRDILKIAVLGSGTNAAVVVSHNGSVDIIDMTGGNKSVDYVSKYIKGSGFNEINTLCIVNRPYQGMTAYDEMLKLEKVNNVIMPSGTYLLDGVKICGNEVMMSDYDGMNISYDNYKIDFYNTDCIEIKYNDFTFKCFNGETDSDATVCVNYGKYVKQNFNCAYLVILDVVDENILDNTTFIGENNLLFEVDFDGNIKVRRLENG